MGWYFTAKVEMANLFGPYGLSMAQFSVRGACRSHRLSVQLMRPIDSVESGGRSGLGVTPPLSALLPPFPDRNLMTEMPRAVIQLECAPLVEGSNADLTVSAPIAGDVFEPLFRRTFDARSLGMLSRSIQYL
jgi:hypothetical protein